jgi:hypothetical protein
MTDPRPSSDATRAMRMDNGASVADWLATAACAARVAAMYLEDVRAGVAGSGKLVEARAQLAEALEECDAVLARVRYAEVSS